MKKKYFALPYLVWMIIFTVVPLILVIYYAITKTGQSGNLILHDRVFADGVLRGEHERAWAFALVCGDNDCGMSRAGVSCGNAAQ